MTPISPSVRKRLGLLSALVDVGAEVVALSLEGLRAYAASRPHDARADQHVAAMARIAQRGAEESSVLHGCPCSARFLRIVDHGNRYVVEDGHEDRQVMLGAGAFGRIREIARGMGRTLTRELARRGWTGDHR